MASHQGLPWQGHSKGACCLNQRPVLRTPFGDKTEALVVRYECRDGTQRMWINPIVRPKTGGEALGDALEMGETAEGRFASLF